MTPKEYTFDAAYQPQVRAKRGTREIMLDVMRLDDGAEFYANINPGE